MLSDIEPQAPRDFNFIMGDWHVKHRRLKDILNDGEQWIEFNGLSSAVNTLGGFGNVEDVQLNFPDSTVRAKAIRSYNHETQQWSIWWLDGRNPSALDTPVVGKFSKGIGRFYADEVYNDTAIKVRFIWDSTVPEKPRWEQAFSKDNGQTWETNWIMRFYKKTD
jgi:hypothetical protein